MIINIKLAGNIPSKKNSRQLFVRNGRMMNIPSKSYREWHEEAINQLKNAHVRRLELEKVHTLNITIYSPLTGKNEPNQRAWDVTNKAESVNDLLVDYGLIKDDSWKVIPDLHLRFGGGRADAGCDIEIIA